MAKEATGARVRIRMTDADGMRTVRTILSYEAGVRNRSMNQAAIEMIFEAIDIDSYPDDIRARLEELAEESRRAAAHRALSGE